MRILILGSFTPGIAVLTALLEAKVEVVAVATHGTEPEQTDWPSLYQTAQHLRIPAHRLRGKAEVASVMATYAPDLAFTIGFRYLLEPDAFAMPKHGCLNFHSSLLPKYRGRAPVNWAIIHGETQLGVTLHVIDAGVDTGHIVIRRVSSWAKMKMPGTPFASWSRCMGPRGSCRAGSVRGSAAAAPPARVGRGALSEANSRRWQDRLARTSPAGVEFDTGTGEAVSRRVHFA